MIPLFAVHMPPRNELMPRLEEVLYSGYIGQGKAVEAFEAKFGNFVGSRNVLSLNSGTSALQLALRLCNLEPGDEVISTPVTCTATNFPILAERGNIVWADVDADTGLIDPLDVERKITDRTRAIMVVHWGGTVCDMKRLRDIADRYDLALIEDAAHALGAEGVGEADFTCYSLQAIKHITTVDGGVLVCRNPDDYKRGKLLRWYGIDREVERADMRCEADVAEWGYKFHMNDVTATMGLVQLDHLDKILALHRQNARTYDAVLDGYFGRAGRPGSSYWLYTITLPNELARLKFAEWMLKAGDIQVSQVHSRNDIHTAVADFKKSPLPGVASFMERQVSIPVHWALTVEQRSHIINTTRSFMGQVVLKEA